MSFEVMVDPDFFHYIKKNDEMLFVSSDERDDESTESVEEGIEAFNDALKDFLDKRDKVHQFKVEAMSIGHKVFGIKPVPMGESIFVICSETSFSSSMLSGIEIILCIFYLSLFVCLSSSFHSDCISALIVSLIDIIFRHILILSRNRYLSKHSYKKVVFS